MFSNTGYLEEHCAIRVGKQKAHVCFFKVIVYQGRGGLMRPPSVSVQA
jgi:hypothetical protein